MLHYSMLIEWSDKDQVYVVTLPEWAGCVMMPATHGITYSEAAKHGQEVLELLVNSTVDEEKPLPLLKIYTA